MRTADLNADLGEGFGAYRCGDDPAMLAVISSANVACGLRAGDPEIMALTLAKTRELGAAVGAHPGYAGLSGFGRQQIPHAAQEIERLVAYQIGAAQALSAYAGHRVTYVNVHGVLANLAARDVTVAGAIARAVKAVDPALALLAIALSEQVHAGEAAGLRVFQEIFADRGYDEAGQLIPRGRPGARIEETEVAAERVRLMVEEGTIFTAGGARVRTPIDSICVHGDSVHAAGTAGAARRVLKDADIDVRAFAV